MTENRPTNKDLRTTDGVIDQRQQRIDPASKNGEASDAGPKRSQKQPGQSLHNPQDGEDHAE